MTIEWITIALLLLVGGGALFWRQVAFNRTLKESLASQSVSPVVQWIQTRPTKAQANHYHQAITSLWKGYERPLAAKLTRSFLQDHPTVPVAHFWVREVGAIEPAISHQVFSPELLEREYKPDLAACCGPTG